MATSYVDYTGDGNNNKAFSFPSFQKSDVKIEVEGVLKTTSTHYDITNYTTTGGGTVVFTSGNIPTTGQKILIYRDTDVSTNTGDYDPKAIYAAGSSVKAGNLNDNQKQSLFAIWEEKEQLVKTSEITNDAITGAKIADDQIDSEHYIAGSIDLEHMSANSVDSDQYVDGSIDHVHLANDIIDGDNIQDDVINSEHIAAGAVDLEHMSANSVDSDQYVDGSIDLAHMSANSVDSDQYVDGSIDLAHMSANSVDSDQYVDGSIDLAHMSANSVDSDQYVDGSIDHVHLSADCVDGDNIADNSIGAEHIKENAVGTSEIADAELVTLAGMQSGTASILASGTALTSTTAELNLLDGKSIVTSVSGSSTDVQLPTAKAVNDQIVSLLNDAGGFVPIADDQSFPNTNPDPDDGTGTIVSIADAGGLVVNGSGVTTTGRTSGGSTVTINGIDSTLHDTTIAAGKGMLVQTTSTPNLYTYHRLVVDEAGVASAQSLVTDFNQRYQVAGSAPSNQPDGTDLVEGDLWFDTSGDAMKVYDGSQYNVVTSVGDYKLLTVVPDGATSGSPDYTNTSFDLRDGSSAASITSVGQLLVSVNGVLQKPNAGSYSASEEGFYLEGTNGIKFCTAPGSGASVFITLIGSATGVNTPATNSIVEAAIQTNVVSEEKLKISNTASDGQFLQYKDSSDKLTWASVTGTPEGTAVKSTTNGNEASSKFLRADGDGTCSWQVPTDSSKMPLAGGSFAGDVVFDNGTNVGMDMVWDESDDTLKLHDDVQLSLGSDRDMRFYHTGSHGYLNVVTGDLNIRTNGSESAIVCTKDAGVALYYDAAKKVETVTGGVTVTGTCTATSFAGDGSALTGLASTVADGCIYENSQSITSSYTMGSGKSGMSAGPITIGTNGSVTIPSGGRWVIV